MTALTPERLAELRRLSEAVRRHPLTMHVSREWPSGEVVDYEIDVRTMDLPEDVAKFHAAAREAVPALLAEREQMLALLREAEGVLRIVDEGDDVLGPDGVTDLRRRLAAALRGTA